ncbi:MAG: sugar transferase [Williamsia sp.]|nr:sugar transferase [Williamsia sp.]
MAWPNRSRTPESRERLSTWADRYRTRLLWSDALVIPVVVALAQVIRFGVDPAVPVASIHAPVIVVTIVLSVVWIVNLHIFRVADVRILGGGATEYSRVLKACLAVFGLLAIVDLLFKLNIARGLIAIALPLGTFLLLLVHYGWRAHLIRGRAQRKCMNHVLVMGSERSAKPLVAHLDRNPSLGYDVVGVCVPLLGVDPCSSMTVGRREVPILGEFADARSAVLQSRATTVAVTSAEVLGHSAMRELSWELEGMHVDMVVDPGVIDVAGPRMLVRPVAGLPLLHIDKPTYSGANRLLKASVDRVGALVVLVLAAPVLLACAIAVKVDSRGPVFYKAERIGLNNTPFRMWKFRSMQVDADTRLADLSVLNEGAGLLFKIRDDPRVTRVGKFIRRYSFDELPQLFNVLGGSMSLVGPRPPLPSEVEQYEGPVVRRMLVRPGITGLWQVSGRSDLSWEEAVRLDLTYVENWSIAQDLQILLRTLRAVLHQAGAY